MRFLLPTLILLLAFLPGTLSAHRSVLLAPPDHRSGHAAVSYGPDHVMVIGGWVYDAEDSKAAMSTTLIFDVARRRWKAGTPPGSESDWIRGIQLHSSR